MPEQTTQASEKYILVVEDEMFLVDAYRLKFTKENIRAEFVNNGEEAVALLSTPPPSLVMLDLLLPGKTGFEVLTAIRAHAGWKNVPVIILSNLSQPKDVERCRELGIDDYIVKAETKISDIVERVKKYL